MYNEDALSGPYGTSPLYTSVWSLCDLHSLGPSALGCVNSIETCTSVYNLHVYLYVCVYSLNGKTVYVAAVVCSALLSIRISACYALLILQQFL